MELVFMQLVMLVSHLLRRVRLAAAEGLRVGAAVQARLLAHHLVAATHPTGRCSLPYQRQRCGDIRKGGEGPDLHGRAVGDEGAGLGDDPMEEALGLY